MQFLQQIQSISDKISGQFSGWVSKHPITPFLGMGALLLIQGVALVAGPIFSLLAVTFNFTVIAFYLKDRVATRVLAVGLTLIILAISLAALFPVHAPIFIGCAAATATGWYAYSFYKLATIPPHQPPTGPPKPPTVEETLALTMPLEVRHPEQSQAEELIPEPTQIEAGSNLEMA